MSTVTQFENLTIDEAEINRIINIVQDKTNIAYSLMKDRTRKREVVIARMTAMFFIKYHVGCSLNLIGEKFGGRDHSTVIHAIETIEDQYQVNSVFRKNINMICLEIDPRLFETIVKLAA